MSCLGQFRFCFGSTRSFIKQPVRHLISSAAAYDDLNGKILKIPDPQLNFDRFCDPRFAEYLIDNISKRKSSGNLKRVIELQNELKKQNNELLRRELIEECLKIPNDTHPEPSSYGNDPKVLKYLGSIPKYSFKPLPFDELVQGNTLFRMKGLSPLAGHKTYYLSRDLAELEHALIRFAVQKLLRKGFSLISVPDILHHQIIECCGMTTKGQRSLVYRLDGDKHLASAAEGELCLSGTAEMALGGFLMNKTLAEEELPRKYVAMSRCFRAETANVSAERGLYRVHQFTKVEMFGVSTAVQSEELLEEFQKIQEEIFTSFELYMRVLDMPPHELGAPAYRKYDIEAWLASREDFGEVSSCSNCTDYQSRRLNIRHTSQNKIHNDFVHTVNGTACAIPRLIMAICETHQQEDGTVKIPSVLRPYMQDKDRIKPSKSVTKFNKRAKELLNSIMGRE